ncbi:hypothetical protein ONZ45_g18902 [Pleurotus djamor]|nr:hypothetical protein ONZ45_g18902 [Pleurotus djamor]
MDDHPISPPPIPTQAEIDARLRALRAELEAISKTRNAAYSATTKLPAEVLVQIFDHVRRGHMNFADYCDYANKKPKPYYTWATEVTHVCSAWRTVALNTPMLWNFAFLLPIQCTEEVLKRIDGIPFDLVVPFILIEDIMDARNPYVCALMTAFANPAQLRSIILAIMSPNPSSVVEFISNLKRSTKMPLLTSVIIRSETFCFIPSTFLSHDDCAPQLHMFTSSNCVVDLCTPRFRHLRVLDLSLDEALIDTTSFTTPSVLLVALRQMPELTILQLKNIGKEDHVSQSDVSPVVLDKLRSLRIVDVSPALLPIFRVIKTPEIALVEVSILPTAEDDSPISSLDDLQNVYSVASLSVSSQQALTLIKEHDSAYISVYHTQANDKEEVVKNVEVQGMALSIEAVWSILPLGDLYSLCVLLTHEDLPPQPHLINSISSLSSSTKLRRIEVLFLAFVNDDIMMDASSFPALEELRLDCIHHKPKNSSLLKLGNWLVRRGEGGYKRLETLVICRCPHFKPSVSRMLGELVDSFEVQEHNVLADGDEA